MQRVILLLIGTLFGSALIYLAFPRVVSAVILLPTEGIWARMHSGKHVEPNEIKRRINAQYSALDWQASGSLYADIATAKIILGANDASDETHNELWEEISEDIKNSLLLAPSSPYAWTKAVYTQITTKGSYDQAAAMLSLALATGPYEKKLIASYVEYATILWRQMSQDDRKIITKLVPWVDRVDRPRLVLIAVRDSRAMAIIMAAMAKDLERFGGFLSAVERQRRVN